MASTCISSCTRDTIIDNKIRRANYNNLYKRPESDAEFMLRSINFTKDGGSVTGGGSASGVSVVDSVSCRQMYLRSYTFSRKESLHEKAKKCLEKVKFMAHRRQSSSSSNNGGGGVKCRIGHVIGRRKKVLVVRKVKEVSTFCSSILPMMKRLFTCTSTKIDVADRHDY